MIKNIIDYIKFLLKKGYIVKVRSDKLYDYSIPSWKDKNGMGRFFKIEIYQWLEDNKIWYRLRSIPPGFQQIDKSYPQTEVEFLHKSDAVLFKLWLE